MRAEGILPVVGRIIVGTAVAGSIVDNWSKTRSRIVSCVRVRLRGFLRMPHSAIKLGWKSTVSLRLRSHRKRAAIRLNLRYYWKERGAGARLILGCRQSV